MSAATVHHFAPAGRAPNSHAEVDALVAERARAVGVAPVATVMLAAAPQRAQERLVMPPGHNPAPMPSTANAAPPSARLAARAADTGPQTAHEADRLGAERYQAAMREAANPRPVALPPLPPIPDATAPRARLADAIRVRDEARRALDGAEVAVSRARRLEADAEAKAAASVTTEIRGGDDLAARIAAWSAAGGEGEAPGLVLDPEAIAARQEGDRARVAANAARQAARQLEAVLADRRAVLTAAETEVTAAKREVARALVEAIAIRGMEAERALQRARVAAHVVNGMLQGASNSHHVQVPPTAAKIGRCGEIGGQPVASEVERREHVTLWSDLLHRLDRDPEATL